MPKGLLDKLTREEILDLVAYIAAGGDPKHAVFQGGHASAHGGHGHGMRRPATASPAAATDPPGIERLAIAHPPGGRNSFRRGDFALRKSSRRSIVASQCTTFPHTAPNRTTPTSMTPSQLSSRPTPP